ncbi:MAG: aminoacyl-tRNA hydrolase [Sphingomonadaceae bacterium]|nr:aminoacyl-tRNA hydrolase [Sphingomonadaceae bacterium]
MQIWAGLGNPGANYALHRHNVGFMLADVLAADGQFGPWTRKFQALVAEGRIGTSRILLMKPQTFMNESGRAIGEALRFFKGVAEDVTIFYDELDLAPMKIKLQRGGGAAGHNGVRSTIQHIGADFRRLRIGIGHPGHKDAVTGHVLGNFAKVEMEPLSDTLAAIAACAPRLADGDDARFLTDIALRMARD